MLGRDAARLFDDRREPLGREAPELGDARETVPIDYAGVPFFVGLNAAYVTDFLSAVDTQQVSLDLKDENSQCIGRPSSNDADLAYEYLYVVMPMRLTA